ncbi:MAG: DUF2752 domain-containing protein [Acidobacteria bacterium]|nr:DUF2752 domain-containing protein [Acidobacteriota bacterium]
MTSGKSFLVKSAAAERVLAAAGILAATTGAFVIGYFNPTNAGFFPVCPLHATTGLNCPGCGLTRGFHALFHGDVLGALHFNALLPVYLFVGIYFFVSLSLVVVRGRGLSFSIFKPHLLWGFLVVLIVFGVVRNLPFYPFTILAI